MLVGSGRTMYFKDAASRQLFDETCAEIAAWLAFDTVSAYLTATPEARQAALERRRGG